VFSALAAIRFSDKAISGVRSQGPLVRRLGDGLPEGSLHENCYRGGGARPKGLFDTGLLVGGLEPPTSWGAIQARGAAVVCRSVPFERFRGLGRRCRRLYGSLCSAAA